MFIKGALVVFCLYIIQNATTFPIGMQSINGINNFNQQLLCEASATPIITEILPSLQFGDVTVSGDLPVGGSIRVKGCFPVYGTVAVEGGLPSVGTAVVNTGCGIVTQIA